MHAGLPPLNGLHAFEVVARCGSLVAASQELNVTASAVGHQVRALERGLGVRLFERQGKRLTLTRTGKRYATQLREGFDLLRRATASVQREKLGRSPTVRASPAVALRWLAPALDRLRLEGMTEFRIDASSQPADLAAGEADLDIRYGSTVEANLVSDVLFSETVFPVCSAAYAQDHGIYEPDDLAAAEILFVDDWNSRGGVWSAWSDWCARAGVDLDTLRGQRRFTEMDKAVQAAAAGEGVAIGAGRHLTSADGLHGLVRPFAESLSVEYSEFLVSLPEVAEERPIRLLRRRLISIARESKSFIHVGAL